MSAETAAREMKAYIGLGGNIGDPAATLRRAIELMDERGLGEVTRVSSFYRTQPVGMTDQPWFVNAAVVLETELGPDDLLAGLGGIESELGRPAGRKKDAPRVIDLDILMMDLLVIRRPGLEIPHPRMHERRFVLEPLSEIAPAAVHPETGKTVQEMLQSLPDPSAVEKMD